jgi:hypothetical protein
MQVTQKYIFAGASCYDFEDRQTRKAVMGSKVHLLPIEMPRKDDTHGYLVEVFNADYSLFAELRKLQPMKPYEFLLDLDISGKNIKARLVNVIGEVKAA